MFRLIVACTVQVIEKIKPLQSVLVPPFEPHIPFGSLSKVPSEYIPSQGFVYIPPRRINNYHRERRDRKEKKYYKSPRKNDKSKSN